MDKIILICEDSMEGVFSAIYEAYARKCNPETTYIQVGETDNYELFATYIETDADAERTIKVSKTINREFGEETFLFFCRALASKDKEKGDAVYHVLAHGLKMHNRRRAMENFADPYVNKVFELSRYSNNEILHLEGFLRFQELENKVLFAKIGPSNNILTFLAPHFADRLPNENFIIYDDTRELCVVHPSGKNWFLMSGEYLQEDAIQKFSDMEEVYQELFTFFCKKIAIKERKNLALQRQMLPLHFQKYMSEFR